MRGVKILASILCCLIAVCIWVNVEAWHDARVDRMHTLNVETAASVLDLYISVLETESGQRGYIITGNVLDAEDYYSGVDRIRAAREKLSIYMDKSEKLSELDNALSLKLGEMASTIQAYHDHGPLAAVLIVKNQSGLRMMKHLKSIKDSLVTSARNGETHAR